LFDQQFFFFFFEKEKRNKTNKSEKKMCVWFTSFLTASTHQRDFSVFIFTLFHSFLAESLIDGPHYS
jgi:hypothetical protein